MKKAKGLLNSWTPLSLPKVCVICLCHGWLGISTRSLSPTHKKLTLCLIPLSTHSDVDAKIAALGRLESDLPSFLTLSDPDRVIQLLKPLLKHPHAQLSNAAINFCHAFFPILRSNNSPHASHTPTAKMAVSSLMPAILERSGDGRERTREAAARALEELGRVAIDCTRNPLAGSVGASSHRAKDQDTPLFQFEKCAREAGLGSKSAKIREQVGIWFMARGIEGLQADLTCLRFHRSARSCRSFAHTTTDSPSRRSSRHWSNCLLMPIHSAGRAPRQHWYPSFQKHHPVQRATSKRSWRSRIYANHSQTRSSRMFSAPLHPKLHQHLPQSS